MRKIPRRLRGTAPFDAVVSFSRSAKKATMGTKTTKRFDNSADAEGPDGPDASGATVVKQQYEGVGILEADADGDEARSPDQTRAHRERNPPGLGLQRS